MTVHYTICPLSLEAHTFEVSCRVDRPAPTGQIFALPAWIPGSYLIRDFARHIVSIRAEAAGKAVALEKTDKHRWRAAPVQPGVALTVVCEIYAWDLSVRGAHLDRTHGFFNGCSVFLSPQGHEDQPCLVDIRPPDGKRWRVATALEAARGERGAARAHGFGVYRAASYDELIDHPVEMGDFTLCRFAVGGVAHEVAITGQHNCDTQRLTNDLQRICEWQIRFFGQPPPMARYVFLVTAVGEGYGGLEHRASTALLCSRDDLPYPGMDGTPERYRGFLGLCSHEYFHTWNVKRIKPAAFLPYDLARENHTRLLWFFEGFTSYYDDLALLRSTTIAPTAYLELLGKTIVNVARNPGRFRQSLAESSFDAWSKFYRPDENSPNAVVSYYAKGALVALALDLTLRQHTQGRHSLDDLMRALWQRYGQTGIGVGDDSVQRIAEELAGRKLGRFFSNAVTGTRELPLPALLARIGVKLGWEKAKTPSLGVKSVAEGKHLKLATVFTGGAAEKAGLAGGDVLVAFDGLRVGAGNLDALLARRESGEMVRLHAFRRDELISTEACLDPAEIVACRLSLMPGKHLLRRQWLGV